MRENESRQELVKAVMPAKGWRNKWLVCGHNDYALSHPWVATLPNWKRDGEIVWSVVWPSREIAEEMARTADACVWEWLGAYPFSPTPTPPE